MRRVLVTGCSGFVGRSFCEAARNSGYVVRGALRAGSKAPLEVAEPVIVGDIRRDTDWTSALENVDLVVHLAAKAHILKVSAQSAATYTEANAFGTERLVAAAASAGVRRFIYMSSVKVNGEETSARPFTPFDEPNPQDLYGSSKLLGEKAVLAEARPSGMEVVIVRSPLVYGPEVRANFAQMMRWIHRGWPLPLGSVANARSLVSIWNLSDLLLRVMDHPAAVGRTFMVSDGVDLSTPELLRLIGRSLGRRARLVRVPVGVLRSAAHLLGIGSQMSKLCGSLQVDISATRGLLDWTPPLSVEDAMARTAAAYLSREPGV